MTLYHRAADMLSRLHITHAERVLEVEPLIAELRAAAQQSALDELVRENERLGLYEPTAGDAQPVAWRRMEDHWEEYEYRDTNPEGMNGYTTEQRWGPLYAAPAPAQPRQPLTDEQVDAAIRVWFSDALSRESMKTRMRSAIERAITGDKP